MRSITGQIAPNAIVNAVFGALDQDSSGNLELAELLSLVESGETHSIAEGDSIVLSGHNNESFNGTYSPSKQINGKTSFKSENGMLIYYFNSGNSPSWNMDDRDQNGSNDWYRGGWTRAPTDGNPPLGTRRWVGAGKLTLSTSAPRLDTDRGGTPDHSGPAEVTPQGEEGFGELMGEIDIAMKYFEGQVSDGEISADQAMVLADAAFERKVTELPPILQPAARNFWDSKTAELESRLHASIADPAKLAAGTASIGAVGAIASNVIDNAQAQREAFDELSD